MSDISVQQEIFAMVKQICTALKKFYFIGTLISYISMQQEIIALNHGLLDIWTELLYLTFPHEVDLLTLRMLHKLTQYL